MKAAWWACQTPCSSKSTHRELIWIKPPMGSAQEVLRHRRFSFLSPTSLRPRCPKFCPWSLNVLAQNPYVSSNRISLIRRSLSPSETCSQVTFNRKHVSPFSRVQCPWSWERIPWSPCGGKSRGKEVDFHSDLERSCIKDGQNDSFCNKHTKKRKKGKEYIHMYIYFFTYQWYPEYSNIKILLQFPLWQMVW